MDVILYYIRDNLVGTHYFMYAFVLLFFMFSIIGYLFKQKYGKLDIILNTSQTDNRKKTIETKEKIDNKKTNLKEDKNGNVESQTKVPEVKVDTSVVEKKQEKDGVVLPQTDQNSSLIIQSTAIPTLKENGDNKQEIPNPSTLPNVDIKNINPNQIPNTKEETPLVSIPKEEKQDLTGEIPEI
ncbi:MAG: hypothetical protein IKN63_00375 [Bacilli bacterium]|nr:hypothetical protein [Bacilli bacterium]